MVNDDKDNNNDEDDNTQALALLLANTTNAIDAVVAKVNSVMNLDIKDHQTVIVFSVIRWDQIFSKVARTKHSFSTSATCFLLSLLHLKLRAQMRRKRRQGGSSASFDIPTAPPFEARTDL